MFYIYTIVIPLLLLIVGFLVTNTKSRKSKSLVNIIFKMIPHLFGYAFFVYFLEMEEYINAPWAFYTIIFYLIPLSIITIIFKIYFFYRK